MTSTHKHIATERLLINLVISFERPGVSTYNASCMVITPYRLLRIRKKNTNPTLTRSKMAVISSPQRKPPLWSPRDRPGLAGSRDRLNRQKRLVKQLHLSDAELRTVLNKMWDSPYTLGYTMDSPEFVFEYIPATTEGADVPPEVAKYVLRDLILKEMKKRVRNLKS